MERHPPDPHRFLPLTHLEYAVLLCLSEEPMHGYALVERIRARSSGLVNPGTGSFYSIIKKLNDDGLIAELDERAADRRRRSYAVTQLGAAVLQAEANRLARDVAAARRVRAVSPGRGGAR